MTRSFANTYCFFELFHFSFSWKFHQIFVIWELIVDKKGGRSAGTPWPRCSWKWVTHKTFPNSNLDKYLQIQISLLCSVQHIEAREDSDVSLRRRRNGSKEEEGGGGHGERPETAKVSSKGNLDPFPWNDFQMSFDGTGCFHWCVGRSAEECTLTRFFLSFLSMPRIRSQMDKGCHEP